MAASAYRGAAPTASATARALLLDRLAWAQAKAGDAAACDRTLGEVDETYADRDPADDPAWTYWLSPQEVAVMAGRCWTELHRPLRAVPALEQATAGYGDNTARESALYLTWLATAYAEANEIDQGAAVATRALRLDQLAHSARSTSRLAEIYRLPVVHQGNLAVDAFAAAYRQGR
jgi:hypothetical protein